MSSKCLNGYEHLFNSSRVLQHMNDIYKFVHILIKRKGCLAIAVVNSELSLCSLYYNECITMDDVLHPVLGLLEKLKSTTRTFVVNVHIGGAISNEKLLHAIQGRFRDSIFMYYDVRDPEREKIGKDLLMDSLENRLCRIHTSFVGEECTVDTLKLEIGKMLSAEKPGIDVFDKHFRWDIACAYQHAILDCNSFFFSGNYVRHHTHDYMPFLQGRGFQHMRVLLHHKEEEDAQ